MVSARAGSGERRPDSPAGGVRGGRVPTWVALAVVTVGLGGLVRHIDRQVAARGVATIDVTRYRLHAPDRWLSEAWVHRLERLLLRFGRLQADDRKAILDLAGRVLALSFVAEVGEPRVDWPDGLTLPIRLHVPVACIKVGQDFLPVAADGTVLAGYSYAPHPARGGYLPVVGPHDLWPPDPGPPQPGDRLAHPAHRDALAVAVSLLRHLDRRSRERLGRALIDASHPSAFDGRPGGVRIDLEGARRIHFGRPPGGNHPGELPLEMKWASVAQGLERWGAGEPFDALDVRWDDYQTLRYDQATGGGR